MPRGQATALSKIVFRGRATAISKFVLRGQATAKGTFHKPKDTAGRGRLTPYSLAIAMDFAVRRPL